MISMYACPIISPTSSPTITPSTTPTQTQTQTFTPSPNPTSNPSNIIYNSFKFFGNLCPTSGYNVTVGNCMNLCDFERISILPTDFKILLKFNCFYLQIKLVQMLLKILNWNVLIVLDS
ncbi:hypothetical protein DDB_G0268436 [Dictyostelium discoideum AX4]|uniref:Uncharacterized protein n=1 Tax=Dictyostelium discoideum TaxID=44689 RepID=Q55FG8_DICDI|nr:hypothetical protein DDB_G0268436 [Dictyostelium discoideum AX4]EAL73671.1 hypothetical protein DDB_G0268436 [Dictyostelium discoideum AX4]|eukprot:XP_647565.1 hypothetical protein DDB_G0268436 [Dictyostelium discoideum AX4]